MRKLITLILILAMFLPAIALADLPDISGLSTDELIELNHLIQMKLFSEKLNDGIRIPQGTYIIGEDIPAGSYRVLIEGDSGSYQLYRGNTLILNGIVGTYFNLNEVGRIILSDGNVLQLNQCVFIFYPYTGLSFE